MLTGSRSPLHRKRLKSKPIKRRGLGLFEYRAHNRLIQAHRRSAPVQKATTCHARKLGDVVSGGYGRDCIRLVRKWAIAFPSLINTDVQHEGASALRFLAHWRRFFLPVCFGRLAQSPFLVPAFGSKVISGSHLSQAIERIVHPRRFLTRRGQAPHLGNLSVLSGEPAWASEHDHVVSGRSDGSYCVAERSYQRRALSRPDGRRGIRM